MAETEQDARLADSFRRLAESERRHADFWRDRLVEAGSQPAAERPSVRARILVRLARRFGSRLVLPAAASLERAATVPPTMGLSGMPPREAYA